MPRDEPNPGIVVTTLVLAILAAPRVLAARLFGAMAAAAGRPSAGAPVPSPAGDRPRDPAPTAGGVPGA